MSQTTLLTKSQFAKANGWAASYVTQLAAEGRLVLVGEGRAARVDAPASLKRIHETRDARRDYVAERHARARPPLPAVAAAPLGTAPDHPEFTDTPDPAPVVPAADEGRGKVRKLREIVGTEMDRIEYQLLDGTMVERRSADPAWSGLGVSVRAGLDAMIERTAPALAACATPADAAALLRRALREERRRLKALLISTLKQLRQQ